MSGSDDYENEMNDVLSDDAIEAFLLGVPHPVWQQDEALATLAVDVSTAVLTSSPSPDHVLLQLFWTGQATQTSERSRTRQFVVAGAPSDPPIGAPRRRLRLLAALAGGMAAALLGVGTAGGAGVLPDPAQRVVARVVEAVSPFEVREPSARRPPAPQGDGEATIVEGSRESTAVADNTIPPFVSNPGPQRAVVPGAVPAPATAPGAAGLERPGQTSVAQTPFGQTPAGQSPAVGQTPTGQTPAAGNGPPSEPPVPDQTRVPTGADRVPTSPVPNRATENPSPGSATPPRR